MKKFFLSFVLVLSTLFGAGAQNWSATLTTIDGLPGVVKDYSGIEYYQFTSELLTPGVVTNKVRMTVVGTLSGEMPNGNNLTFALSELKIYDRNGMIVPYTASSNADHNALALYSTDGAGLDGLSDNNVKSYFHSMWEAYYAVADYHYVELALDRSVDSFYIEWSTRLGQPKNAPTNVGITLGTDYSQSAVGGDFALGNPVTAEVELAVEKQLFVLQSNSVESFMAADGTIYSGSGPLFMQYAEKGDVEASVAHIMQLVPAGDGRYLVYWPVAGKFLANSASSFNGANGWQYSTTDFASAASVKIEAVDNGYFELQYDGENSAGAVTLYIGAEMRDGTTSKMKTFDLPHKQALERGDYTQGFALPVAFNWSIYKARLDEKSIGNLMISVPQLAQNSLGSIINEAGSYLAQYGNHGGYCTAGEDAALRSLISSVQQGMSSMSSIAQITSAKESLLSALSNYMAAGLSKYEEQVNALLANSTFSQPPYVAGTYPESSRSMLSSILTTIATAKEKVGVYGAAQYVTIYSQLEQEIERFLATKIEDSGETGGDGGETPDVQPVEGDVIYVYLSNGDVEGYALASLDGDYYIADGTVYFPLAGGETIYYTKSEYDSISVVAPVLPTMTSFKFNNKYNPTLNVDVECAEITNDINLSVNAIGKWLTASFQLSDDKAVAYVDTVLQVSKETRQSFAKTVSYKVTYPGYNIVKRIKVQDEIWTTPSVSGETVEVGLTADMLSTNKPSTNYNEGLENLLDGSPSTIFHSTWGSANDATVNVNAYIQIALPEQLENIQLYYQCRPQTGYNPLVWEIYASNDGNSWKLIRTLDYIADGMPRGGRGQEYTSPTIALGNKYSYLRIVQTSGEYSKNHLAIAELRVYKVIPATTEEPVKIQDAVYENRRVPFGNTYNVTVDWLTDRIAAVPRIDIDIDNGLFVTSKDYYLNANFRISGNGVYENFTDSVQIKGRGNSSWSANKKPYRLKFEEKVKPFGLTKGKSWVLLANAQRGSLMANAIAMKIGQMAGAKYTNHIIPVELYMNGSYMGSYMFTEKVGMANNSVDIDEEDGYLVELDTYENSDEPIYRTGVYSLPVKVAEPDLDEYINEEYAVDRRNAIIYDSRIMQNAVSAREGLENVLDVDATARFFLANDLVLNQEINHPKSTFYFRNESDPEGKITFGPLWDFDWGFNYENGSQYCYSGQTASVIKTSMAAYRFWLDMTNAEVFKKHYYHVWKEFMENNSIAELHDYIDSYYSFAKSSFENNAYEWGYSYGFSESDRDRAKQWVSDRANYIYNNLDVYNVDDLIYAIPGDVDLNNQLTVHDAAVITAYLQGDVYKRFSEAKADANTDGYVDLADAEEVASLVMMADAPSAVYALGTPLAAGELYGEEAVLAIGEEGSVALKLMEYEGEEYKAVQFDVRVPEGVFIDDIMPADMLASHNFLYEMLDMNTYRVIVYSEDNEMFGDGEDVLVSITASATSVIEEDDCVIEILNAYAVDGNNDEVRFADARILFNQTTGIAGVYADYSVKGGDCITFTALEAQEVAVYGVDGRLVCKQNVKAGTMHIQLPAGVYIVNGEKVVVY